MRANIANQIDSTMTLYLAKPHYEKFIELASVDTAKYKTNLITAYHYMAFYFVQHEENEKALEYYEKILVLDPEDSLAIERIKLIKER